MMEGDTTQRAAFVRPSLGHATCYGLRLSRQVRHFVRNHRVYFTDDTRAPCQSVLGRAFVAAAAVQSSHAKQDLSGSPSSLSKCGTSTQFFFKKIASSVAHRLGVSPAFTPGITVSVAASSPGRASGGHDRAEFSTRRSRSNGPEQNSQRFLPGGELDKRRMIMCTKLTFCRCDLLFWYGKLGLGRHDCKVVMRLLVAST